MPVTQASAIETASNFTLTNSPSDVLTLGVVNYGSGAFGYLTARLRTGNQQATIVSKQQMTAWGNETLTLSVDLDAVYATMTSVTSADFVVELITYDSDATTQIGYYTFETVTGTVDTTAVHATMTTAAFGRYDGGTIYPDVYAGYGMLAFSGGNATPGRGAVDYLMDYDIETASYPSPPLLRENDPYITIPASLTYVYYDSRGTSASQTLTNGTDYHYYNSYSLPEIAVGYARGSYSGGVWTTSPSGNDVRISVALTADANVLANSHTVTLSESTDGGATQTQTVSANGTYYFYETSLSTSASHTVFVTAQDDLQYGDTEVSITVPILNVIWQPYADGTGFAFYATPQADKFIVGKASEIDSLKLNSPLPITSGGTGGATKAQARANLGIVAYNSSNPVPVNAGGTGASSASVARANLGINYGNLGTVGIADGGTGATSRGAAVANLNGYTNAPSHFAVSYNSLDATGLVTASATIYAVANAAPANSVITWTHSTNHAMYLTNAPENTGVVTLTKGIGVNYMSAMFYGQSGRAYFWKYSGSNSNFNNYWQRLSVASAATMSDVTAAQSLTTTATLVNLDKNTVVNASDDSISVINNGFRLNYAGYVEISAQLYAGSVTTGDRLNLNIYAGPSGSVASIRVARYDSPATHVTGNIAPFLYQCSANDLIYLYAHNGTAARGSIATGNQTYLTVKYI